MKEELKPNEARPMFRLLSFTIAIPAWVAGLFFSYDALRVSGNESLPVEHIAVYYIFAVAFTYLGVTGYMPRLLLQLVTFRFLLFSKWFEPDLKSSKSKTEE